MDYIIPAFTMLTLDSIYLSSIGGPLFRSMVKKIQKEDFKINIYGAIASYILLLLVLYKFIIKERNTPNRAFLLGFCIYGIFDSTNYALFNKYKLIPAIIDSLWGGCLFYIVTIITYKILGIKY
tara:strand:- start:1190 stop:1561 length:372 start_codon:yes stop_codon:yes gene_type:complete